MMMGQGKTETQSFPEWVPAAARNYLEHTEAGRSIRALARAGAVHPSTILRQVRRFECRRDDPLIDDALRALSKGTSELFCDISTHLKVNETEDVTKAQDVNKDSPDMTMNARESEMHGSEALTQARIDVEARRILRRLCEQGAVLAVAREMESAVVVREAADGTSLRTAVVAREIAQAMALKDWIACPEGSGRIARYFITNAGRAALRQLTAEDDNRAHGFADSRTTFAGAWDVPTEEGGTAKPRYYATESPLVGLSRRKDKDGQPFLDKDLVAVGERLREDFELSQMGPKMAQNWDDFMSGAAQGVAEGDGPVGAMAARARVQAALADMGPGLGDVVLRCCCFLEGLEVTEKKMGWSARSGKIVLRIALQRLKRHYAETQGRYGPMIG